MTHTETTWLDRLEPTRLENQLQDFKPALTDHEAHVEANRCINCYDAPCIKACPTGIDIPQFIRRIGSGNRLGAAKTILDSNIMGLSCAVSCPTEVLCEGACVYNKLEHRAITIGKLQRYAVEHAYETGHDFYTAGRPTGKRVALLGAGPASLACAHELRKSGHETVIFEKSQLPGGLNTHGIAPYKMKAQVSLWEIEQVTRIGVKIEFGKELGRDLKMDDLVKSYDAVFLGLGLGPDSRIEATGADLPGIEGAVEWIAKLKTHSTSSTDVRKLSSALVVGGGNTALDACRELKKLGVPRVMVSYRRSADDMSGYTHEMKWALQEGVEFLFHTVPTKFETSKNGLKAQLQKTSIAPDGKVRTAQESMAESVTVEAGLVLMATGQAKLKGILRGIDGLQFEKGRLLTDPNTGRTGHKKIYAGGDLANGGKEVVNAVAEGKRAALAIHKELSHG